VKRLTLFAILLLFTVACGKNTPPEILQVTQVENTRDVAGPYEVLAFVIDDFNVVSVELRYKVSAEEEVWVKMAPVSGDVWGADIPGQAVGSRVKYYVAATDGEQPDEEIAVFPATGEGVLYFDVVP
jgi:hypothetical protein